MKVSLIVQARMASKRLPGKVMKRVLGRPLLFYLIERLKRVEGSEIIIATTTRKDDDPIVQLCKSMQVKVFRGSVEDVLSRYVQAAKDSMSDVVVRITADCPLIDPGIIGKCIEKLIETGSDYVSNTHKRSFPRGMDVEAMKGDVLKKIDQKSLDPYEREHVTPYIMRHPEEFAIEQITFNGNFSDRRLTVDTEQDFQAVKNILESLYPGNPNFTLQDILKLQGAL